MKNILKKNQVIITALAIMIAVAGYLNFTQDNKDKYTPVANTKLENDLFKITEEMKDKDQTKVSKDDVAKEGKEDLTDISAEDLGEDLDVAKVMEDVAEVSDNGEVVAKGEQPDEEIGESVLVNSNATATYFSAAKLKREQTRAKNKEILMELVENTKINDKQKQDAINRVIKLTEIAEKESATEITLEAKGFESAVVSILNDGVEVIVNASSLTEQQAVQIEDIVKRKTDIAADKIVILPAGKKTKK